MKLLVIGTDDSLFDPASEARARIDRYAALFDELHIAIASRGGFGALRTDAGAFLYPIRSRWYAVWPFYAFFLGKRICEARGITMVSAQDPAESGLAAWLISRSGHIPLHVQIHADYLSPYFRAHSLKDFLRFCLARFLIPRASLIRVVSERIRKSIVLRYPALQHRIVVLPIFVPCRDIAASLPAINPREEYPDFSFVVCMASRLTSEKNIALALLAFRDILKQFSGSGLIIVGDGPERRNLEEMAEALGIQNSVRFRGYLRDVIPYYKTSDIYLLTSDYEGYARSVVEAASLGLPVLMTDVGAAGDIIRNGETGTVVPVRDTDALREALQHAMRDIEPFRTMAERARELILLREPSTMESYLKRYRASFEL